MRQIEQTYAISAPVEKVWAALTTSEVAEQWGAAPAKVDAREGGKFSYWDGDIHGTFTKLAPNKLIEQDWYGHHLRNYWSNNEYSNLASMLHSFRLSPGWYNQINANHKKVFS